MKKQEQNFINALVEGGIYDYNEYIEARGNAWFDENMIYLRLRHCSAYVMIIGKYRVLKSYETIIAIIDTGTDTLYDFLRLVYGYTATSAMHIAKFEKDYCKGKWNCEHRYTWRPVK